MFPNFFLVVIFLFVSFSFTYSQVPEILEGESTMIDLQKAQARWISRDTIVWPVEIKDYTKYAVRLYHHPQGNIYILRNRILFANMGSSYKLSWVAEDVEHTDHDKKLAYLEYLRGKPRISTQSLGEVIPDLIQGDLVIALEDKQGKCLAATRLQIAGLLDDLYAYDGPLGVSWDKNQNPTFRVWAPTCKNVKLHLYQTSDSSTELESSPILLRRLYKEAKWTGVWYALGTSDWVGKFYLLETQVFHRTTGNVESYLVTDPYSVSLSTNSKQSQMLPLASKAWKPEGWDDHSSPMLKQLQDISIYELHVRDFSIADMSVSKEHRGTYLAFCYPESNGTKHLAKLRNAGITHIHLLPTFDIATIEDRREQQKCPDIPEDAEANSTLQQEAISKVKDEDGYNWGYDPYHYQVPEGSYSTNPEGSSRILEFRQMVQSLHNAGFRVVLDVVFNHTNAVGSGEKSVLDKIVPGYYYRLNDDGNVSLSSCGPDTASEHYMMEKLILDTVYLWATEYRVDGFRFDLMGHHTTQNMKRVLATLRSLTLEKNGVDGSKIYVYGEAWRFGSLDALASSQACYQVNTYGLGIGSFNDRIRDSVRGGSPFTHPAAQGFCNGLYYNYNGITDNKDIPSDLALQKEMLLDLQDVICVGLAGNLRDFQFISSNGKTVQGSEIAYHGKPPTGYASQPIETINYVSVHDNHTLWDCIQAKAPFDVLPMVSVKERVQMQKIAVSLVALGQGIPFFQAGDEILRSKSGDGDSYNSGDWFNQLDFTYSRNNWGIGLPSAEKNRWQWDFWKPRLGDARLCVEQENIVEMLTYFQNMLKIRYSSPLFRLASLADIQKRVSFPILLPGVITMCLRDDFSDDTMLDTEYKQILCIFNALPQDTILQSDSWKNMQFIQHPLHQEGTFSIGESEGIIRVPGYSVVVLVLKR